MNIKTRAAFNPGTTDQFHVWVEIESLPRRNASLAEVEETRIDLYELTIEAMRHEVEKYDELKSRMEHSTNGKLDTSGHVFGRSHGSIAAAARIVCAVSGFVAVL